MATEKQRRLVDAGAIFGAWKRKKRLIGEPTYRCSGCGSDVRGTAEWNAHRLVCADYKHWAQAKGWIK